MWGGVIIAKQDRKKYSFKRNPETVGLNAVICRKRCRIYTPSETDPGIKLGLDKHSRYATN
jgi:hypothetical protein